MGSSAQKIVPPPPPPGFVLETIVPPPPPGFVRETIAPTPPGFVREVQPKPPAARPTPISPLAQARLIVEGATPQERALAEQFVRTPLSKQLGGASVSEIAERVLGGQVAGGESLRFQVSPRFGPPSEVEIPAVKGMAKDAVRLAAGLVDFFQTPEGLAAAGATAAGAGVPVALYFAGTQAIEIPSAVKTYLENPTPENLQQALLLPGFVALLSSAAGRGLARKPEVVSRAGAEVERAPEAKPAAPERALPPPPAGFVLEKGKPLLDEFGDTIERGGHVVDSLGRRGRVRSVGALVQDLETGKAVFREDTLKVDFGKGPEPVSISEVTVRRRGRPKALEGIGGRRAREFGLTEAAEMERFAREGGFETLGAAKKGERFSTKTNIAQLTKSLSRQPVTPIVERVAQSRKLAQSLSGAKDTLARATNAVLADGVAARDILFRPPKWTSFEDALGKFDGAIQVNARDLREFSHRVGQSFPNKIRREAITNWIQAEGNTELLGQRAAASKPHLRRGYEEAARLTEEEQAFARNISSYFDAKLEEAIDAGLLEQGVQNYVNQLWHRPDNPIGQLLIAEAGRRQQLKSNPDFIKRRIFSSYFEGEQAGFNPKNKDIAFLVSAYDQAFNKATYSRALIKSLLERKAEDGRPIAVPSGGGLQVPRGQQPPDAYLISPKLRPEEAADYKPIDHPALRKWTWATKDAEGRPIFVQGDILIHPAHATHLKNAFSTSALRKTRVGRGVLCGVRELKATLLSFSGFHQVQEGLHALGHKVVPFRTERIDLSKPNQRALAEHGLQIATFDGAEMFAEGVASTGLVNRLPVVGGYLQRYTDWLFHEHIPELKMGMALEALDRNRQRFPKLSEDQLMKLTSQQANAAFGELNYRMMGRNPTFQDTLRLATLAPDFLEARARFVGQALKPYGREQAAALIRLALGLFVTTRIANKIFDDDYHWDRPFSFVIKGREFTLRTVPGDIMHLLDNPRNFVYWRINPTLTRPVIEGLTGRDGRGRKRILREQLKDWILGHVPIPLQSIVDERDRKAWEGLLQSLGIGTFQYRTAAERLAGQYVGDLMPSRGISGEQRKKSRFRRQLIDRIQSGDKTARTEALAALGDKTINPNDYNIILRESRRPRIFNLVNRLPLEQAMDVWDKASQEERRVIRFLLLRKRSLLFNETPERRAVLEERLRKILGTTVEPRARLQPVIPGTDLRPVIRG